MFKLSVKVLNKWLDPDFDSAVPMGQGQEGLWPAPWPAAGDYDTGLYLETGLMSGFIPQTTGITLPGISTTVVIIHVFVNRSINYHLESRTKISADISTPGSLYLLTGDSKCLYKSLCLCGFLMATEFMQHLIRNCRVQKDLGPWAKIVARKCKDTF